MERKIVHRKGIGATAYIVQARKLLSTRISVDMPTIIVVHHGNKCLRWGGNEMHVAAGDVVAVAGNQVFDVINTPCEVTQLYEADWLVCSDKVVSDFLQQRPQGVKIKDVLVLRNGTDDLQRSFHHACAGLADSTAIPDNVAAARLHEMLNWLDHFGAYFSPVADERVSIQLRRLINADLSAPWTAKEAALKLGMSEATLRRRLNEEETHFQKMLTDIRMSHALTLLQVTGMSVTNISYEVGYNSPSRFTLRFRERFGYNPSDVRPAAAREAAGTFLNRLGGAERELAMTR